MASPPIGQSRLYLLPQGIFLRAIAYVIDSVIVGAVVALALTFGGWTDEAPSVLDMRTLGDFASSDLSLIMYAILIGYYVVLEATWGRTLGKRAVGIEVVRARDGVRCGWRDSLIRNALRPLDMLVLGLPGALLVLTSRRRQRLGDLAGGTLVVRRLPALPSIAGMPLPGVLRRCEGCGTLVEAPAQCPRCGRAAPTSDVPAPMAAMMAVGGAAGAFAVAADELLAAEARFSRASSAEYDRLHADEEPEPRPEAVSQERALVSDEVVVLEVAEEHVAGAAGEGAAAGEQPPDAVAEADGDEDDELDYSAEYLEAWTELTARATALRRKHVLLEEAATRAGLSVPQAAALQPTIRDRLDTLAGYLSARDDTAVFEAFKRRVLPADG
jgi:uncharacterized RDD family membrane protein YckC